MKTILENIWATLGIMFASAFIAVIMFVIFSNHKVNYYYVSGGTANAFQPVIYLDVNWQMDQEMRLDRSLTYNEAVDLVNKLNNSLQNKSK